MYKLMATEEFTKAFDQLTKSIRERFKKQLKQVQEDPFSIGKPLGYPLAPRTQE